MPTMRKGPTPSSRPMLIAVFAVLALVSVLCASYIGLLRKTVSNEATNYLGEIASHVADAVNCRIEAGFQTMKTTSAIWSGVQDQEIGREYLAAVAKQNDFFRISVGTPGGWTYSSDGASVMVLHPDVVRRALAGEETISGLEVSPIDGQNVFLYSVPAYRDGEIVAAIIGSMYPEKLRRTISVSSFGGQGYSVILDRNGNFMVDSRSEVGASAQKNYFKLLEQGGSMERGSTVEQIKGDLKNGRSGVIYYHFSDGVSKIMNYMPLSRGDWYLMSVVPTDVAEADAQIFIQRTVYVTMAITALFIFACILILLVERKNQRELRYLALVDRVTGGMSAQCFAMEVQKMLAGAQPGRYQMVALDIHRFKLINDTYSSSEGDRVLCAVHDCVKKHLGSLGLVSRISADNFCILLENWSREETVDWLERIAADINGYTEESGEARDYFTSFSAGVYVIEDPALDIFTMQDRANVARKNARNRTGRLCSVMFYSEMERRRLMREQELENRREQALRDREFVIYLQPQISLRDGTVNGAEALIRWLDPVLGVVRPDEFIPLFERNGFVVQLDLFVFEEVCKLLRRWLDAGMEPFTVSVNLSKIHLLEPDFLAPFLAIYERYRVPAQYLEFEFTETVAYQDMATLAEAVERIHAVGFTCALDDFGASSSSLNNLKDTLMDVLKLDRAFFVGKDCYDERAKQVVGNIIKLARQLNMKIVAEGIENLEQLYCLRALGCDAVQGFIFSKPLPAEEFERYAFENGRPRGVTPDGTTQAEWRKIFLRNDRAELFGESSFGAVLDMLPGGVFCCEDNQALKLISYNRGFLDLLGYSEEELHSVLNDEFARVVAEEDREAARAAVREQMERGSGKELEYRIKRKDGSLVWVLERGRMIIGPDGKRCYCCILLDGHRAVLARGDLVRTVERDRMLLGQTGEVLFDWDLEEDVIEFSGEWKKKYGYRPRIEHARHWFSTDLEVEEEDVGALRAFLTDVRAGAPLAEAEVRLADRSGTYRWCQFRAATQDKKVMGVIRDIDAEKRQTEALRERAQRDMLTGLYNKVTFQESVERALKDDTAEGYALSIIDVDDFKLINDTCGHLNGDAMLADIAAALQGCFSDGDLVGRIGGDEFCALGRDLGRDQAVQRAELVLERLRVTMRCSELQSISCSIGVACSPDDGGDYTALFQHADLALYHAKQDGKNRVRLYQKDMEWSELQSAEPRLLARAEIDSDRKKQVRDSDLAAYVFRTLYETSDTEQAIPIILEILGYKYNVSRVYINELSGDERSTSRTFEWCADGVESKRDMMQQVPVEELGEIIPTLRAEGSFRCNDTRDLSGKAREWIERRGTRAVVQYAVQENGELQGAVGFDECRGRRDWSKVQLEALTFIASILSTFLMKRRAQKRSRLLTDSLTSIMERRRGWIYVVKAQTHEILYANKEFKRSLPELKLGMKCHELLHGLKEVCPFCPALRLDEAGRGGGIVEGSRLAPRVQTQVDMVTWMGEEVYLFVNRPADEAGEGENK
ncbi:MAG: EAL domain-containing protein [Clostridia bacterium]|nr:EAL domain-containing protein [Clostridia bacterium]